MKRIIITVALLLMLTACVKSGDVSVTKTDVPYNTQGNNFEIVFSTYRQGNTVLYYPRFEGVQQQAANEAIFEDAKNAIALFSDDIVCITIDYEIVAQADDMITIKYTGHGSTASDSEEEIVEYISIISIPDGEIIK